MGMSLSKSIVKTHKGLLLYIELSVATGVEHRHDDWGGGLVWWDTNRRISALVSANRACLSSFCFQHEVTVPVQACVTFAISSSVRPGGTPKANKTGTIRHGDPDLYRDLDPGYSLVSNFLSCNFIHICERGYDGEDT